MKKENNTPSLRFQGFEGEWEEKKLGELLQTLPYKEFLKEPELAGKYEVIQQGNDPVLGFADGSPCMDFQDVVIFGDHTMSLYKPRKPFFVATDGVRILKGSREMDGEYLLALLERYMPPSEGYKRYYGILSDSECCSTCNLDEQRKIAILLQNFAQLLSLQAQKLEKFQSFKKAMLEKMFPQKGSKVPEIRFQGFTEPWEDNKLEDIVDVHSGKDYKHLSTGSVPVYGTGGYMLSVNQALSYADDAIGIGRKGTIDKPFILRAPFWTVDTLFFVIPRQQIDLSFMFAIFQNIEWEKKDESTGVPSLSKIAITGVNVLRPSYAEQQRIGLYFASIDRLISLQELKIIKLQGLKKALLERMFPPA